MLAISWPRVLLAIFVPLAVRRFVALSRQRARQAAHTGEPRAWKPLLGAG